MNSLSLTLYRKLYLARSAEEHIIKHYPEDEMKTPMHMSMGQEAIPVGVVQALGDRGQIFASYRSHATFLAKTENSDLFFAELYGKETGTAQGKGGSMHLAAPEQGYLCSSAIVASTIPVAVGAAFANKRQQNGKIACVFFGDGALDEGVFWESLNVASVMQLPVLLVCEDNDLAVHTFPDVRQGYRSITDPVGQFACHVLPAETSDAEELYHLATKAISLLDTTGQPVFMHLKCYRYLEHVGIGRDFHEGYRSQQEYDQWYSRDTVRLQRDRLLQQGHSETEIAALEQAIDQQIAASIVSAQKAPFPAAADLYRGVFHEEN